MPDNVKPDPLMGMDSFSCAVDPDGRNILWVEEDILAAIEEAINIASYYTNSNEAYDPVRKWIETCREELANG